MPRGSEIDAPSIKVIFVVRERKIPPSRPQDSAGRRGRLAVTVCRTTERTGTERGREHNTGADETREEEREGREKPTNSGKTERRTRRRESGKK